MNIEFDEDFKKAIVDSCLGSIGILQEILNSTCKAFGVTNVLASKKVFVYQGNDARFSTALNNLAREKFKSSFKFLKKLSDAVGEDGFYTYFWLVQYLYENSGEEWEKQIKIRDLVDFIETKIEENEINKNLKMIPPDQEMKKLILKSLEKINEESRKISSENNLFYNEKELYVVNSYLSFYLKYCDYEDDLIHILPPWEKI